MEAEDDRDFEVTAEMLIHDTMDDETTLAEEEAHRTKEEDEEELNDLQEEGDMPLEQLLSLYGYGSTSQEGPTDSHSQSKQSDSGTTTTTTASTSTSRSRRRNKVVPLEPQRAVSLDSSDTKEEGEGPSGTPPPTAAEDTSAPSTPRAKTEAKAKSIESPASEKQQPSIVSPVSVEQKRGAPSVVSPAKVQRQVQSVASPAKMQRQVQSPAKVQKQVQSVASPAKALKQALSAASPAKVRKLAASPASERLKQALDTSRTGTNREQQEGGVALPEEQGVDTEGEEVDILEVDESLRIERDNNMLKLDDLGLNVVRMDDIEAGLRSEGASALGMPMGHSLDLDVNVLSQQAAREEGEGLECDERLQKSPVYEDVLLSSGNNNLLLDTAEEPTVPSSPEGPSPPPVHTSSPYTSRLRPELPERRSKRLMNNMSNEDRAAVWNYFAPFLGENSDSESDEEYSPREEWKKEVKVGEGYQAHIPDYAPSLHHHHHRHTLTTSPSCSTSSSQLLSSLSRPSGEPCPPQQRNSGHSVQSSSKSWDRLMWSPRGITDEEVSTYLESVSEVVEGVSSNPRKDHEQALQVLLQCNHNPKTAIKKMQATPLDPGMKPWTEEECSSFEEGLRFVRKDFFLLQKKVPSRTVKEIVEFYYLWKKSERYDQFIQRYGKIGRKKIQIPPGHMSDFMDKYLDMHSNDAMDIHYMTTTVPAELKKDN